MSKVEAIERNVERLDDTSFAAFREWFLTYDNARWDRQIEADSLAGKLDPLATEALTECDSGKTKPL